MVKQDKKTKNAYNLILLILGIVGIGFLLANNGSKFIANPDSQKNQNQSQNLGGGDFDTQELVQSQPNQKLIYEIKTQSYTDIYSYDFSSSKTSKIFTDRDEEAKIKSCSSTTKEGKILVLMSKPNEEFMGSLYLVNTDGSGKKEPLISDFASPQSALISPESSKISYVLFSNAEKDFGFKLILANNDGSSKKQLTSDATNITLLGWSPDSQKIAYIKGFGTDIYSINVDSLEDVKLTSLGSDQIQSFSWYASNDIILSKNPKGNNAFNQAEIFTYNVNSDKIKQITTNSLFDNYPYYDSLGNLVYLSVNYDVNDSNARYTMGKITLVTSDGITEEITEANQILGWSK